MTTLHTVNNLKSMTSCRSFLRQGDALLFIEDGVYCCIDVNLPKLLSEQVIFLALEDDIKARGLEMKIISEVKKITFNDFVALCCEHDKSVSWF